MDIFGHRGARGLYPENTLEGFKKVLDLSVKGFELDIVISRDQQLVVSHEPWMNHIFCLFPDGNEITKKMERHHNIYTMDYEQIAEYDCGSKKNPLFPNQQLFSAEKPLLTAVFNLLKKKSNEHFVLFLEVKSNPKWYGVFQPWPSDLARMVAGFLEKNTIPGGVVTESFDPNFLNAFKAFCPNGLTGLIVENKKGVKQNLNLLNFKPDYYNPDHTLVNREMVSFLKQEEIGIVPWTVNTTADMKRLEEMGIQGVVTDYPDKLLKFS